MTEDKPKILIEYDNQNYSHEQIAELNDELSKYFTLEKSKVYMFSIEHPSYLVFLLASLPVIYFSKGFFTTLGADLAHELSRDIIEGYRKMKQRIAKIITRPVSKDIPTVIFGIPLIENQQPKYDQGIMGIIKTIDERLLSECFDHIEELCRKGKTTMQEIGINRNITKITFHYDTQSKDWEPELCTLKDHTQLLYKNGKWELMQ